MLWPGVATDQQSRAAGLVKGAHFLAAPLAITLIEPVARRFGPQSALIVVSVLSFTMLAIAGYKLLAERQRGGRLATESV